MDRQPGAPVRPLRDQFARLHVAVNAVFGTEQRQELHLRRAAEQVNRRFTVAIDPGRVRD